jgi:cytochrome c oxidase subunit 2
MHKANMVRVLLRMALPACAFLPVLVSGCNGIRSLQPKGIAAERIAELWWFQFFLAIPFFLAVVILLLLAIRRRRGEGRKPARSRGMAIMLIGGVILPALAMVSLMYSATRALADVSAQAGQAELTVEVQGERWWWRIGYTEDGNTFFTANEIHIPAGVTVSLALSSDNVIHSFWVPELNGKRDLIPGVPDTFWIQANSPGTYHGQCAEFCGAQHAKMHFLVIALEPQDFGEWLDHERQPATLLTEGDEFFQGQQAFLGSPCIACHTIRGTSASGTIAPDLTHLGSRQDIGAGTLSNVPGNLAAWIVDSQQFKPGNLMPPVPLPPDQLTSIVGYLESLQ